MPLVFEYFEFILSVNIPSLMHLIPWITIVARIIPPPNSENIKIPPNKEKCKRFSIEKRSLLNVITMKKMKRKRKSYNEFSISNQFSLGWKTFRFQLELGTELLSRIFSIKIKLQSHKNIKKYFNILRVHTCIIQYVYCI